MARKSFQLSSVIAQSFLSQVDCVCGMVNAWLPNGFVLIGPSKIHT